MGMLMTYDKWPARPGRLATTGEQVFGSGVTYSFKHTGNRGILCYWATEKPGITGSEPAVLLNCSQSATVYAVRRGREIVQTSLHMIE